MFEKFAKPLPSLLEVKYEIRGPLLERALELESQGHKILKLNIGNPAAFGFDVPEVLKPNLLEASLKYHGYCDSKGHLDARKAIIEYNKNLGIKVTDDLNRVFIGNGVSELIMIISRALCEPGDEILVPAPDYPLWTAAVSLAGGKAVHYFCDEANDWNPDVNDIRSKISPRTKAIVIINPNNPTGAVYSPEVLNQIVNVARENEIMILSDEIYDRVLYDGSKHTSIASLAPDCLCITFNGASKSNRLCGYRLGWAQLSGPFEHAPGFLSGLNKLTSMRLCSVSPYQALVKDCLFTDTSIRELTAVGGRLYEQNKICFEKINSIPGLKMAPTKGSLYGFVKIDLEQFDFIDDEDFAYKLLNEEHVMVVHGKGFNCPDNSHFRIVFLPDVEVLSKACDRIASLCERYRKVK